MEKGKICTRKEMKEGVGENKWNKEEGEGSEAYEMTRFPEKYIF